MRRLFIRVVIVSLLLLTSGTAARADQLVWTPINPSFGGSPFNADWLMAQAEAQKPAEEEPTAVGYERDPLQDFKEGLNRQILSRLSSRLIEMAFGEGELAPGYYEIGDYIIEITTTDSGIRIIITDPTTGGETTMEIPYY